MEQQKLTELVAAGFSHSRLAEHFSCSKSTVRYWLKKYNLVTGDTPHKPGTRQPTICTYCGETDPNRFYPQRRNRCSTCSKKQAVLSGQRCREKARSFLEDTFGIVCTDCWSKYNLVLYKTGEDPIPLRVVRRGSITKWKNNLHGRVLLCRWCAEERQLDACKGDKLHQIEGRHTVIHKGYVIVKYPRHPYAWKNNGYVYLHRLLMENYLNRLLREDELVHHEDDNPLNNLVVNLKVTTASKHSSHHINKRNKELGRRSTRSRKILCAVCGKVVKGRRNKKYCSPACTQTGTRKIERPEKQELEKLVWSKPSSHVAKELGVSDTALGKWCKQLGVEKPPRGYWNKKRADGSSTLKNAEQLKSLVWSYSLPKLRKRYNIPERTIRRWCKEFSIAMPPKGYWTGK